MGLRVTRTSNFNTENLYWDKGSGADLDGAFWRPKPPSGYNILGDYAQGNYCTPYGTMIVAQDAGGDPRPSLALPTGFTCVWTDKGSGADENGSIWWPEPPTGYVAMGGVAVREYAEPKATDAGVYCVRFDLVVEGKIGGLIWNDKGSGADEDVSIYKIEPASPENFAVGGFYAQPNYDSPKGTVFCLKDAYVNA